MRKCRWVLVFALLFSAVPCCADEIGARVLLPDGKPAVGAKVYARIIERKKADNGRYSQQEVTTETDLLGYFAATVPPGPITAGNRSHRPYLLIDAPGCALYFAGLDAELVGTPRPVIRLQPDFHFRGTVLGPDKKPIAGAEVKVVFWIMNIVEASVLNAEKQIVTPQLITKTGKDGKFSLRGIAGPVPQNADGNWLDFGSGRALISATVAGRTFKQTAYLSRVRHGKKPPEAPKPVTVILMYKEVEF